ncbi:MAG: hypothetical protein M1824_003093 [Vezdaea acicularis]|nr:MAG: hypothetical protein M1824_003093 [Vezdaea acicularis]
MPAGKRKKQRSPDDESTVTSNPSRRRRTITSTAEVSVTPLRRSVRLSELYQGSPRQNPAITSRVIAETRQEELQNTPNLAAATADAAEQLHQQPQPQQQQRAFSAERGARRSSVEAPERPEFREVSDTALSFVNGAEVGGSATDRAYDMNVAVQPPRQAQAGSPLEPVLHVRLIHGGAGTDDAWGRLLGVIALTNEDGTEILSPPRLDLLDLASGTRVSSPSPFLAQANAIESIEASRESYMSFPGLAINRAGTYRLRINLLLMGEGGMYTPSPGAAALWHVDSRIINVLEGPVEQVPLGKFLPYLYPQAQLLRACTVL